MSNISTPAEKVQALNRRIAAVKLYKDLEDVNRPTSSLESLHTRIPPPDEWSSSPDEAMHQTVLRNSLQRAYYQIVTVWTPFFRSVANIAQWKDTQQSLSFTVLYFVMWYYRILLPALFITLTLFAVHPNIIHEPIFNTFKGKGYHLLKDSEEREIEADAELLGDEVDNLLGLSDEISVSEEHIEAPAPLPSMASNIASTVTTPLTRSYAVQKAISDRLRLHGQPIQTIAGGVADVHERIRNASSRRSGNKSRFKIAAIPASLCLAFLVLPFQLVIRVLAFVAGAAFFGGHPLYTRSSLLRKILDPQRGLFKDMPTNVQLYFRDLRLHPEWLVLVLAGSADGSGDEVIAEAAAVDTTAKDGSPKPKATKRSWSSVLKSTIDLAERASEMATGQSPISLYTLRDTFRGQQAAQHVGSTSCFAVYGKQRGHIAITATSIQFFAGFHFKRNEPPQPILSLDTSKIQQVRKVQALQAVEGLALSGLGDGIEICMEDSTLHRFKQIRRRDEIFFRLLLAISVHQRYVMA